ncbi:hypothetical protein FQA39_LY09885 [Lamprigera yunnana]|nr:hypothetical protein FQA39_LY09885 [Lamprigera yunnana]
MGNATTSSFMDNSGFQKDLEEGTDLGLVNKTEIIVMGDRLNGSAPYGPSTSCKPEICHSTKKRFQGPDLSDSPWHKTKTIALVITIILFVIWVIVYTVLSQLDLL